MAKALGKGLDQLPEEMLSFVINSAAQRVGPRVGTLNLRGRSPLRTPNFLGNTSRGAIPHLSQDTQLEHSQITALYLAIEDCMAPDLDPTVFKLTDADGEKKVVERVPPKVPPVLQIPTQDGQSPLRLFTGQDKSTIMVLGPRRLPPVEMPLANSNKQIGICTSVGFRHLAIEDYISISRGTETRYCRRARGYRLS